MFHLIEHKGMPDNSQIYIPWILWGIWKQLNFVLYAGNLWDIDSTVRHAIEEAELWDKLFWTSMNSGIIIYSTKKWIKAVHDVMKHNVHSSRLNYLDMCGGAWITRDHSEVASLHSCSDFILVMNRFSADQLHCILCAVKSLRDLHLEEIKVWSDWGAAIKDLTQPKTGQNIEHFLRKSFEFFPAFTAANFILITSNRFFSTRYW